MTTAVLPPLRGSAAPGAALGSGQLFVLACVWLLSLTFVWSPSALVISSAAVTLALVSEASLRGPPRRPMARTLARVTRLCGWLLAFAVTAFYCAVVAFVNAHR